MNTGTGSEDLAQWGETDTAFHPLVVSGPPRSGTTLLYSLFDHHPDVFWLVTEGYLFEYLYDMPQQATAQFVDALSLSVPAIIDGLRAKHVMPPLHQNVRLGTTNPVIAQETVAPAWSDTAFEAAFAGAPVRDVAELWYRLARAYAAALDSPPKRFCCIKAPDYGRSAVVATTHIAAAKAIIIVRHPLRALDSLKRVRELRDDEAKRLTWPVLARCVADMNAMAARLAACDPDRVTWLRYEGLTADPQSTMRGLAQWAGLQYCETLARPSAFGRDTPSNSSFAAVHGIRNDGEDRALQRLTDEEVDYILRNTETFRRFFAYPDT